MGVVWMVLLHPAVHCFSRTQQCEAIDYVYEHLWSRGRSLVQEQDHLMIYRVPRRPRRAGGAGRRSASR